MTSRTFVCWLLCLAHLASSEAAEPVAAAEWGAVAGRVVIEGDLDLPAVRKRLAEVPIYEPQTLRDSIAGVPPKLLTRVPGQALLVDADMRGVANAFVYLRHTPTRVDPALVDKQLPPMELVCRDHAFHPRALIARVGQTVHFVAAKDQVDFSVMPLKNRQVHPLVAAGRPKDWTPHEAETLPFPIRSNLERAAESWCLVVDHPYAVLSARDGSFRLEGLPAGELEFSIWHETVGYLERRLRVTVEPNQAMELPPIVLQAERVR